MILETGTMRLICVREIINGKVNDVVVCREESGSIKSWYTVWMFKDHNMARTVLAEFDGVRGDKKYPEYFSCGPSFCLLFPYVPERPLQRFYIRQAFTPEERERIWRELVFRCMSCGLPAAVLYLLLTDGQLRLDRDGTVSLQYVADFEQYDQNITQKDCVRECAAILLKMLEEEGGRTLRNAKLLRGRLEHDGYEDFMQLYQDIRILTSHEKRDGVLSGVLRRMTERRDIVFRIMLLAAVLLAVSALILFLSQLISGDMSILRIFKKGFETIGTESLLQ